MKNPEILARRRATLEANRSNPEIEMLRKRRAAEAFARPEVLERHAKACAEAKRRMMEDPAFREKMRIAGLTVGAFNASAMATPEARAKAALSIRAAHLSWCPPEFWDLNKKLKRCGFSLSERQAMIASEVRRNSPEEVAKREARQVIHRITSEMHAKQAREKAQAY
jgi:uncharacterized protein (DUF2461 family)